MFYLLVDNDLLYQIFHRNAKRFGNLGDRLGAWLNKYITRNQSHLLAFFHSKRPTFLRKMAGEPVTSFSDWRCLFENIRTELSGLGGRPHHYLASLEVRGKNSPNN